MTLHAAERDPLKPSVFSRLLRLLPHLRVLKAGAGKNGEAGPLHSGPAMGVRSFPDGEGSGSPAARQGRPPSKQDHLLRLLVLVLAQQAFSLAERPKWFSTAMLNASTTAASFVLAPQPAQAQPAAPTGLKAVPGDRRVTLTWDNPNNPNIAGWEFSYNPGGLPGWGITGSNASTTSYTVTGLTNGQSYGFWINYVFTRPYRRSHSAFVSATVGPGVLVSPRTLKVVENLTGTYTVKLNTKPAGTVTVTPSSGDTAKATVSGALTFTTSNWSQAQTVTVTGAPDTNSNDETVTVSHGVTGYGAVTSGPSVTVTVTDPPPGVLVSTEELTVAENATGAYTVKLNAKPAGTVTVTPSSGDTAKATVSAALTFTTSNWSQAQTVTVTGTPDINSNDETVTVSHGVTGYGAVTSGPSVTVTVTDTTVVAPVLTTATSTTSGTIDLAWTHAGPQDWNLVSGATGGIYWVTAHRLKGSNTWNRYGSASTSSGSSRRTMSVSLDNDYPDGAVVEVRVRAETDTGAIVGGPWSNPLELTYKNGSLSALTVVGAPVTVGVEATATYTVALTKAWAGTLSVTSSDTDKATVTPATLTFTTATYNTAQTVTVTGIANGGAAIGHAFRLTGASTDAVPDAGTVAVAVGTGEAPAASTIALSTASTTITEGNTGKTDVTVTVNLGEAAPAGGLALAFRFHSSGTATLNNNEDPSTTCTSPNPADADVCWSGGVSVTIPEGSKTATWTFGVLGDTRDENDETLNLRATAAGWTGGALTLTIEDDDDPGVIVSKETLTVTEGGTGTYTVKLNTATAPAGTVTVTPASGDTGAVTFSPASLTFDAGNYGAAQTVTVTGEQDPDLEDEEVTVSHTVAGFAGVGSVDPVTVKVVDDEGTITLSSDQPNDSITEGNTGKKDVTVTVNLGKPAPSGGLVLTFAFASSGTATLNDNDDPSTTCTSPNPADADVCWGSGGVSVTIPEGSKTGAWTFGVLGDTRDENDETLQLRATAATAGWIGAPLTLTIEDDDDPSVIVSKETLTVTEGGTGTYTVKLNTATAPAGTVTVTPASGDTGAVTFSPASLTFDAGNYGAAQTVTVTGEQDPDQDDEEVTVSHTVAGFAGVGSVDPVTVTVVDDEGTITLSSDQPNDSIAEGDSGTKEVVITATLSKPAPADFSLTIAAGVGSTAQISSRSGNSCDTPLNPADTDWCLPDGLAVTIAEGESKGTQTIRIIGDKRDEPNETVVLAGEALNWVSGALTLTIVDEDESGVTVAPGTLTVTEGDSATYTVKLDTQPAGTVTVTPASGDTGAVTFSPASLTFDAVNYGQQTVTVTGEQDLDLEDEEVTVSHTVAGYAGVDSVDPVTVNVVDDEGTITLSSDQPNNSVTEGDSDKEVVITATLSKPAPADFSLTIAGGGVGSTAQVSNRSANSCDTPLNPADTDWCLPNGFAVAIRKGESKGTQTIRIFGDDRAEPNETIVLAGEALNWVSGALTLTIEDDDTPGVTAAPETLTVTEGDSGAYTVKLDSLPAGTVTVTPASGDTGAVTFSPASLTFLPANYRTEQTVTVTGEQDEDRDNEEVTISHGVTGYAGVSAGDSVTVTVAEDEGTITLTSDQPNNSLSEGDSGTQDVVITVTLSEPAPANFSLHVAGGGGSTAQLSRRSGNSCDTPLNPADTDWCLPDGPIVTIAEGETRGTQTIRIFGDKRDETHETIVLLGDAPNWGSGTLTLTLTDDDDTGLAVSPGTLTLAEGASGTYTVKLNSEPPDTVTVTPSSRDTDAVTFSPASLTFTTGNYGTAQTVTVTAKQDSDADNESVVIRHGAVGADYGPGTTGPVTVNVTDDDIVLIADGVSDFTGYVGARWTYNGPFPSGAWWQARWIHPEGGATISQREFIDMAAGASAELRKGSFQADTGKRYAVQIRLRDVNGNPIATSNWASAMISGTSQPTLVSDPDRTIRVGPSGTAQVCYNLLAVTHGDTTYLETRGGKTPVAAHSALKHTTYGVQITEAPSVISNLVVGVGNVNFSPCATLGPGVHRVTWSWNGPDSRAIRAGRTSTTFTVLPADFPAWPTGLTATAGNGQVTLAWNDPGDASITRWEVQWKEGTEDYGDWTPIAGSGATTTRHRVTGLTNGTVYGFRIRTVNASGTSPHSNPVAVIPVLPDVAPGVSVAEETFTLGEGASGTYTVALKTQPAGTVIVTPDSSDPGAVSFSPASLVFTPGDYRPRTVTVTAEQDPDANNESVTVSHAVSGYGDVSGAAAVTVNVADDDLVVSASGSNGRITATWTYNGSFRSGWKWQWQWFIHPQGGASFGDIPAGSGTASTRTASFAPPNANARYAVKVRLVNGRGDQITESKFALATAGGTAVPTLVSTTSQALRVGPQGTALVCFNLLAVLHDGTTYLEKREGETAVEARSELKNTVHGVEITEAPAVIRSQVVGVGNINFDPCATVGVGVHSVTWKWNGLNGLAREAGETTTTFTVLPANVPAKPAGFTATAGDGRVKLDWDNPDDATITRWQFQRKEGAGDYGGWTTIGGSGAATTSHTVTGLGRSAYGFRIRAVNEHGTGLPSDERTATPSNKVVILSTASATVVEGDSGRTDVTVAWTLGEPSQDILRFDVVLAAGATATDNTNVGSTSCTAPSSGADVCWPGPYDNNKQLVVHRATSGSFTIGIPGDTREEEHETLSFRLVPTPQTSVNSGWTRNSNTVTVTIANDDGDPGVTVSEGVLQVYEGGTGAYTVKLDTPPAGTVTVTPSSSDTSAITVSGALTFDSGNYSRWQTVTVTGAQDSDLVNEVVTVTNAVTGYAGVSNVDPVTVNVVDDESRTMPTGFRATAGDGRVTLDWDNPGDATITKWQLQQREGAGDYGGWTIIQGSGAATTSHTVTGLKEDVTYGFRIRAVKGAETGVPSEERRATTWGTLTLTLAGRGDNRIAEGDSGHKEVTFNIDLSRPAPAGGLTVTWALSSTRSTATLNDNTGSDSCTNPDPADADVCNLPDLFGKTTVAAGERRGTFSIGILGDTRDEADETLVFEFFNLSGFKAPQRTTFTVVDNDVALPGVVVTPTALTVEEGSSGAYTVKLNTEPAGTVTVTASSGDDDKVGISPQTLTFTTANYSTARTVTVTGEEDGDGNDEEVTVSHTVAGYAGVSSVDPVTVTVKDGDKSITLTSDQPNNRIVEGDSEYKTVTLTATLSEPAPTGGMRVVINIDGDSTASLSAMTNCRVIEIFKRNYDACFQDNATDPAVVLAAGASSGTTTFRVIGDTEEEGDETIKLVGTAYTGVGASSFAPLPDWTASPTLTLTIVDDDSPGVSLSRETLTVTEGGSGAYTVKLNTEPSGTVTVTPSSSDEGAASFWPSSLVFTTSDYGTPQEVAVTGELDRDTEDEEVTISHRVTGYTGVGSVDSVAVTVEDDKEENRKNVTLTSDQPDNRIVEGSGGTKDVVVTATLSEPAPTGGLRFGIRFRDGGTARGSNKGLTPCDVPLNPPDTDWCYPSGSSLTIAEGETKGTRTVRILGDTRQEPDETIQFVTDLGGWVNGSLTLTIVDDDSPGVSVSRGTLTVTEGETGTYTVKLNTAPPGTVTVSLSSGDDDKVSVSPQTLTFNATNYGTAQAVTVTGEGDGDADDEEVTVSHTVAGYAGVGSVDSVTVTVADDEEEARTVTLTSDQPNDRILEGSGGTKDVVLTATLSEPAPAGGLLIGFRFRGAGTTAEASTKGLEPCDAPLAPADTDWCFPDRAFAIIHEGEVATTGTIRILGDTRPEPDETIQFVTDLSGWINGSLVFTVQDDDSPGLTVSTETLTIDEGASGTYTVRLNTEPAGTVTVTPSSGDKDKATVSPEALTFTTANYGAAQAVTVTGKDDDDAKDQEVTVSHTVTGYAGVSAVDSVTVTVKDDDEGPGLTLSREALTVAEGGTGAYTVRLNTAPKPGVTVTVTVGGAAGDVTATPDRLTFTMANYDVEQTVTVGAALDRDGERDADVTLTHRASGGGYGEASVESVTVSVTENGLAVPASLAAVAGNTQASLIWNQPKDDSITGYKLRYGETGARDSARWVPMAGSDAETTSHLVTGLDNGVEYSFQVRAVNAAGDGPATDWRTATPGAYGPAAPVLLAATSTVSQTVSLTWTHAGSAAAGDYVRGASGAVRWQMQHRLKGATGWRLWDDVSRASGASLRRMSPPLPAEEAWPDGAVVEVRVRAASASLHGPWSNIRTVRFRNDALAPLTFAGQPVTVGEGAAATYTVKLTRALGGVVSVTSNDPARATVSPSRLTFSAATFNRARTVTVTGVARGAAAIAHAFRLTGAHADAVPDGGTVGVTVAPVPGVTLSGHRGLQVREGGTATYGVKLDAAPTGNVTVTPFSTDTSAVTVSGPLTFTTANYGTAQTVTLTGTADSDSVNELVTVSHGMKGGGYDTVQVDNVNVNVADAQSTRTVTLTSNQRNNSVVEGNIGKDVVLTVTLGEAAPVGGLTVYVTAAFASPGTATGSGKGANPCEAP